MSTGHSLVTMQSHPCPLSRTAIKCNRLNLFESKKLKTVSVTEIGVSPSIMVEKIRPLFADKIEPKANQFILFNIQKNTTDFPDVMLNRDHFGACMDYGVEVFDD